MLRQIRDSSKSLAFYVLGGIVVAVLIISFGTPSIGGLSDGGPADAVAARIGDAEISQEDFRQMLVLAGAQNIPVEQARMFKLKENMMDNLIKRELLAQHAESLGLEVSVEEAEEFVVASKMMLFGREQRLTNIEKDGVFDLDRFNNFLRYVGINSNQFMEMQRRELAAARVRDLLASGAVVSLDEVKARYVRQGNQINLEYLRFPVRPYQDAIEPTTEEIAAYLAGHEDEVKKDFEAKKFLFEKVEKERKIRHVALRWGPDVDDSKKAALKKVADKLAAQAARSDFRTVFVSVKTDAPKVPEGASVDAIRLGWRSQNKTGLPTEVEAKVFASEDNKVLGPETGNDGYYIVSVEGTRQGALTFDDVKMDLAEDLARQDLAKARAKADALAALQKAKDAAAKDDKATFQSVFGSETPDKIEAPAAFMPGKTPPPQETGLFSRRGSAIEGIGVSPELAKSAFALTAAAPLAGPVDVAGSQVIVRLKERQEADMEAFEKSKADMLQAAREIKGRQIAEEWARNHCKEAQAGKKIEVSNDALVYQDGKPLAVPYEPCVPRASFGL